MEYNGKLYIGIFSKTGKTNINYYEIYYKCKNYTHKNGKSQTFDGELCIFLKW